MSAADMGADLKVFLGPPGLRATDTSSVDVRIVRSTTPGASADQSDLELVEARENLAQALMLRLLTPRGALAGLGHADYGSRLIELIGRRKTESARALCKAFVLEVVAQEPRVDDKAVDFAFDPASEGVSELRFNLAVRPRDEDEAVQLAVAVGL